MDDVIKTVNFGVGIAGLLVLIWYTYETWKLRKAAEKQIVVSQDLLRAANDQAEGAAKPYMTIRAKLRESSHTLLNMDGAVGGSVVWDEGAQYVAINIGGGPALNVSYFFSARGDSKQEWKRITQSYFQSFAPKQQAQMALAVNAYAGEHKITFLFQSLGGRWYESIIGIESKVLTDSGFRQLPESFKPSASYTP